MMSQEIQVASLRASFFVFGSRRVKQNNDACWMLRPWEEELPKEITQDCSWRCKKGLQEDWKKKRKNFGDVVLGRGGTYGFLLYKLLLNYPTPAFYTKFEHRRGDSLVKRSRMLIILLRSVNHRFWSHLGCSGRNATIFSHQGMFRVTLEDIAVT